MTICKLIYGAVGMRCTRRMLFLFMVVCLAIIPVFGIDRNTLENRHRDAVSETPGRLEELSNLAMTGIVEKYGLRGGAAIFCELPDQFSFSREFATMFEKTVVDGNRMNAIGLSGRSVTLSGAARKDIKILQFILGFQYLQPDSTTVQSIKETDAGIQVDYLTPDDYPLKVIFDRQNYLIQSFSYTSSLGIPHEFTFRKYRSVGGLVLPYTIHESGDNPAVYTFSDIYVNQGISGSRFKIPSKTLNITMPDRGWGRIPINAYFGVPFVKGWIGNSPALTFLLDFNLPFSVIDRNIASQLGLTATGKIVYPTRYPTSEYSILNVSSFLLREIEFKDKMFLTGDMMPASINIQLPIHGILGADFFCENVITLDLDQEELIFFNPKSFKYSGIGKKIPLRSSLDGYSMVFQLNGVEVNLEISTSLGDSILLTEKSSAARAIQERRRASVDAVSTGIQFGVPEKIIRLNSIKISDYDLPMSFVHIADFPETSPLSRLDRGWIGCNALKRFTIVFDFPKSNLYLKPSGKLETPDVYNASGMFVIKSGNKIYVQQVIKGSPAERAGIQPGDIVLQINQIPAENMVYDRIYDNLTLTRSRTLPMKIQRGEEEISVELTARSPF